MSFALPLMLLGALFPVSLAAPAVAQPKPTMRIHEIDVGQGAATLIELPCGAMLIDTGGEKSSSFDGVSMLTSYLDAFFARRTDLHRVLDVLVVTHPHIDHVRGVPAVLAGYAPRNVVEDGLPGKQEDAVPIIAGLHSWVAQNAATVHHLEVSLDAFPRSGKPLHNKVLDPFSTCNGVNPNVAALWGRVPTDPGWGTDYDKPRFDNENNHSVVTRVDFGAASVLITGDLEDAAIPDMLAARKAGSFDVDAYVVGHHGSENGTTVDLLRAITPQWALIGAGPPDRQESWTAWDYGHPREWIVDMLQREVSGRRKALDAQVGTAKKTFVPKKIKAPVYATGWDGTVVLEADASGRFAMVAPDWKPASP